MEEERSGGDVDSSDSKSEGDVGDDDGEDYEYDDSIIHQYHIISYHRVQ